MLRGRSFVPNARGEPEAVSASIMLGGRQPKGTLKTPPGLRNRAPRMWGFTSMDRATDSRTGHWRLIA